MTKIHTTSYRVYYEDTDAGGIMYHGNFINFCERARSDLLREMGLPSPDVVEKLGIGFVVRHLSADYLKMVTLDNLLTVHTHVISMKNTSFLMHQRISCQNIDVFKMDVTLVCIDTAGNPAKIPATLRDKFNDYLEEQ